MTLDEIRESATMTDDMLMAIKESNDLTMCRLRSLIEGIDYEEHPVPAQMLTKALNCIKQVKDYVDEVTGLNCAYYDSAIEQEREAEQSSGDDLDNLIEQIKGALAGATPGSDVVIVLRKEDNTTNNTLNAIMEMLQEKHPEEQIT